MRALKKDQKGQTVIEYLLMLLVMVSIITSLLTRIKTQYLGDATKCDSSENKQKLLCKINGIIESSSEGKKFQRWRIK